MIASGPGALTVAQPLPGFERAGHAVLGDDERDE
jgi:hypothetical protein